MLLFNQENDTSRRGYSTISKHPMLLFNKRAISFNAGFEKISKHPMLLFNESSGTLMYFITDISKHPMLLFNYLHFQTLLTIYLFQNILCYCLTTKSSFSLASSNAFQNILCYCLTNVFKPFSQLKSLYTPILHYLIQNYQPANHLFKCVFI